MFPDRAALTTIEIVEAFSDAVAELLATLDRVDAWDDHGLGEWTVRELAAHTIRAMTTIELYLIAEPLVDADIVDATGYFRAALAAPNVHAGVAERGRENARTLTDPAAIGRSAAERVVPLVAQVDPQRLIETIVGRVPFREYLAGRVVELTIHTTDIQAASGQPITVPETSARVAWAVLAPLAEPAHLLRAITGRDALNVLG